MEEKKELDLVSQLNEMSGQLQKFNAIMDVNNANLSNALPKGLKEFEECLKELKTLTLVIQSTPVNLSAELDKKATDISRQIIDLNQKKLKEFVESLLQKNREHNEAIKDTIFQLNCLKDDVKNARLNQMKKYLKGLGVTLAFSSLVGVVSSYATIRFFPHKVNIDNPQKIEINNSDVGLWSSKNVQVKGDVNDYRR
ncbi:MAG: hypothetical protein LCH20_00035 [Proteobacteria bacterium]|nr:hypothetical protein [Pseudomonadota bacterium]